MSDLRQFSFENEFIYTRNDIFYSIFLFVFSPLFETLKKDILVWKIEKAWSRFSVFTKFTYNMKVMFFLSIEIRKKSTQKEWFSILLQFLFQCFFLSLTDDEKVVLRLQNSIPFTENCFKGSFLFNNFLFWITLFRKNVDTHWAEQFFIALY